MRIRNRPGLFRAALAAGTALGLGLVATLAAFTDDAKFTTTFTTGDLDLTLDPDKDQCKPQPYTFTAWKFEDMEIGDSKYAELKVNNSGTLDFEYKMLEPDFDPGKPGDPGDTDALKTAMHAGIKKIPAGSSCDASGWALAAAETIAAEGPIKDLSFDTPRPLKADPPPVNTETLCFKVSLPTTGSDAGDNLLQGGAIHPTFQFVATQLS